MAKACPCSLTCRPNIQISTRLQLSHVDIWNAHRVKLHPHASKYPPLCPIIVHSSGMAHPQKNRPWEARPTVPEVSSSYWGWRIPGPQVPRAQSKVKEWATKGGGVEARERDP